jgi:Na+/phosphate symporter
MDILDILQLLGGVGLFLYGLSLMSSSLEKLAGSGLERILEKLTTSKKKGVGQIKGWSFGVGVTAIIQSSAAQTIMLSGFVNAGIMKLGQALPVVFGSNVGSTVTAQILRLGDIGSDTLILQLLKPSSFAPMLVAIGAFLVIFTKKKKVKDIAGILVGLGMLFYGMTLLEQIFEPLRESKEFQSFFTSFKNPILGLLAGLAIAAIIQNSNAAVGILQSLSVTGTITYAITIPMIIGINIGKCMPIVLGMIGSNKKAKKVSMSYLLFNIIGAAFWMIVIYVLHHTIGLPFFNDIVNRGSVANVHFLYNFLTSIIMLLLTGKIEKLCNKLIGEDVTVETDKELAKLDEMLLNTPTVALEQCKHLINKMGEAILENYHIATNMIYKYDAEQFPKMEENEAFIDKCETVLSAYIVKIDRRRLTPGDKLVVSEILNSISDLERMGDYCMNIAYVAQDKNEKNIHFSPYGHREVNTIIEAVKYAIESTINAFMEDDKSVAVRVEPLSEVIDSMKEVIKNHHVERLQSGDCSIEGGVSLFDLLTSFERIASHAANVALHVIKRVSGESDFDEMHGHANDIFSEEYKALYHYYESQYIDPILRPLTEEEMEQLLADRSRREAERSGKSGKAEEAPKTEETPKDDKASDEDADNKSDGDYGGSKFGKVGKGKKSSKDKKDEDKSKSSDLKKKEDKKIPDKKHDDKKHDDKKRDDKKQQQKKKNKK